MLPFSFGGREGLGDYGMRNLTVAEIEECLPALNSIYYSPATTRNPLTTISMSCTQGIPYLLLHFSSARNLNPGLERAHAVHCASVFFFNIVPSHSSETSEDLLYKSIYRIRNNEFGFVDDNPIADKGNKMKKIFYSCKINRREASPKT